MTTPGGLPALTVTPFDVTPLSRDRHHYSCDYGDHAVINSVRILKRCPVGSCPGTLTPFGPGSKAAK